MTQYCEVLRAAKGPLKEYVVRMTCNLCLNELPKWFYLKVILLICRLSFLSDRSTVLVLQANVYSLPFADNTYDVITGWGLLLYLSEPQKALHEMLRVLKPGGIMAFVSSDFGGWLYMPDSPGVVAALDLFQKLMVRDSEPDWLENEDDGSEGPFGVHVG